MSTVIVDETKILETVATATGTDINDYFKAIKIKHLGHIHVDEINNVVSANTDLFSTDIQTELPASFLNVFVSTSGYGATAPDIQLVVKRASATVIIDALNSSALVSTAGVEFRIPATKNEKYNIRLTQDCTVDIIKIVEFHQST
tara:strand:+ start:4092 stop:4526 length:435 start_codon:yes stop_codon:yes gene_type:complete